MAAGRWMIYQRERFPLLAHGVLIAAFSAAAVGFSAALRQAPFEWMAFGVAFVSSFVTFAHLRIADEFKDFEEDSQFRPYRPVPRGLVTLRELGWIAFVLAGVQCVVALLYDARLLPLLLLSWGYLGLMSREFFVRDWLVARPVTYLWTHMLIMPIVDFYGTACDWMVHGGKPPGWGLVWFLAASFFNGIVIEVGRKIRVEADEEPGVRTYSRLWGRPRAVGVWLGALAATALCAAFAERSLGIWVTTVSLAVALSGAVWMGWRFLRETSLHRTAGSASLSGRGGIFETYSAIWTLVLYLTLGLGWHNPLLR